MTLLASKFLAAAMLWATVLGMCSRAQAQLFEAYYMHSGNFPVGETQWSDDAQGVAHDDNNWFITNTHYIRKVPVTADLRTVTLLTPGVIYRSLTSYPELAGYNHCGDPDTYTYGGVDYLVVPIENSTSTCGSGPPGAIAILRCSDLSYVWHTPFPGQCNDAGWVAIDELGFMMSSRQHVHNSIHLPPPCQGTGLRYYAFEWELLRTTGQGELQFLQEIHPTDEQGNCLEMATMQGGEFAPGGRFLYLVSGFYDDDNGLEDREGIHVLDTSTYQRIQHSSRGSGHFDYYYDPGFPTYEEPEGLTIWDLDDGRAPGIRGQLHVFVSDNDIDLGDSGDIDFKHYTSAIRTDRASTMTCQTGTLACPFHTLADAINFAWTGGEVRAKTGIYLETPRITKRVRMTAEGGSVRIGG
jgi:hypothetical protein